MKDSIFNFDKREAVDAVRAQRARTIALLEDLTEAQWETEIVPGWRTREVAAHLVSTDEASVTGKYLLWGVRRKPMAEIERWNEQQVGKWADRPIPGEPLPREPLRVPAAAGQLVRAVERQLDGGCDLRGVVGVDDEAGPVVADQVGEKLWGSSEPK